MEGTITALLTDVFRSGALNDYEVIVVVFALIYMLRRTPFLDASKFQQQKEEDEQDNSEIGGKVKEIKGQLDDVSNKIDKVNGKLSDIDNKVSAINEQMDAHECTHHRNMRRLEKILTERDQ